MALQGELTIKLLDGFHNGNTIKVTLDEIIYQSKSGKPLIEFNEKQYFSLTLLSSEKFSIFFENPFSEMINILCGIETKLSYENDQEYVPGDYLIKFQVGDSLYDGYFRVLPSSLSRTELYDLRNAIEKFQDGLSRDLFFKQISDKSLEYDLSINNAFANYKRIQKNINRLKREIDFVINNPITGFQKKYEQSKDEKRQDSKTERWKEIKSEQYQRSINDDETFLNRKLEVTLNNEENSIIKFRIAHFNSILEEIVKNFKHKENISQNRIRELNEKIKDLVEYQTGIDHKLSFRINSIQKEIEQLKREIEDVTQKIIMVQDILSNLVKHSNHIKYILESTWLTNVESFQVNINYKSIQHNQTKRLLRTLDEITKSQKNNTKGYLDYELQFRPTSYLFEVYTMLVIHSALLKMGYNPIDTEIFQRNSGFLDVIAETVMIYQLNNRRIEVRYDKSVPKFYRHKTSGFYNINANHNKPDFLIAVFNQEDNNLLDAFIIEAKCTKTEYLYGRYEETKLTEQFKDYLSFAYIEGKSDDQKLRKGVIRKVMVVYPDVQQQSHITEYDQIEFIGVNPSMDIESLDLTRFIKEEIEYS